MSSLRAFWQAKGIPEMADAMLPRPPPLVMALKGLPEPPPPMLLHIERVPMSLTQLIFMQQSLGTACSAAPEHDRLAQHIGADLLLSPEKLGKLLGSAKEEQLLCTYSQTRSRYLARL